MANRKLQRPTICGNAAMECFYFRWISDMDAYLVSNPHARSIRRHPVDPLAFLPPHSTNRHDAGCRGAGVGHLDVESTLTDHVWTVKELIERAAS